MAEMMEYKKSPIPPENYAYNVEQPGTSLKTVARQNGNILSGTFRGLLSAEISRDGSVAITWSSARKRDVLTFHGPVTQDRMDGMYCVHGQHAPWKAERTN